MTDTRIDQVTAAAVWDSPRPARRSRRRSSLAGGCDRPRDRPRRRLDRFAARPSTCATAAPLSAASTCRAPSPTSAARSPLRCRPGRRRPGAPSTAPSSRSTAPPNKSRLGGNAIVAVSMAVAQARGGVRRGQPLWRLPRRRGGAGLDPAAARSRSSAAAPMPGGASTSRTSWSSARAPAAFARRSTGPPRSTAPPAAARRRRPAQRHRRRGRLVAGLRQQRGGARRCWCGPSRRPAWFPANEVAIALDVAASEFGNATAATCSASSEREARFATACRTAAAAGSSAIRSSPSRIRFAEDDAAGFRALHRRGPRPRADRRRRPARHQRRTRPRGRRRAGARRAC